jgi:hypothetical protein
MRDEKQVRDQGSRGRQSTETERLFGWQAARKGEPRDVTKCEAWLDGYRQYHWTHGSPAPGSN